MITAILLPMLTAAAVAVPQSGDAAAPAATAAPQVQVWLSGGGGFVRGDQARG